jgi:hypothetical protein
MYYYVQPREIVLPRNQQARVQQEIRNFLQALNSYPARVAKEPHVSFQQHLCSIFAARHDNRNDRRAHHQ